MNDFKTIFLLAVIIALVYFIKYLKLYHEQKIQQLRIENESKKMIQDLHNQYLLEKEKQKTIIIAFAVFTTLKILKKKNII